MSALFREAWDRLSLYLPVFLMGVLAFGSYWLVRSTPIVAPSTANAAVEHEPDYFIRKFSVRTFDQSGRLKSEVFGEEARHFPDTNTLEIDQVRIRAFNQQGRLTTATAQRALTNADASEVQLFGDAKVVREAMQDASGAHLTRDEFRSEFLHAYMNSERVKSHLPVHIVRGQDLFSADALAYDNLDRVVQLSGRVKATLVPSTAGEAR